MGVRRAEMGAAIVNEDRPSKSAQAGFTLVETLVACLVLLVGVVAVMSLFGVSARENYTQGRLGVWLTLYAQNKLGQLNALDFNDSLTDTTVWPPATTGGTGLCNLAPGQSCGSVDPAHPVTGFVDYLDASGNLLGGAAGAAFVRQWEIVADVTGQMKTITVTVWPLTGTPGSVEGVTLVATKYNNSF